MLVVSYSGQQGAGVVALASLPRWVYSKYTIVQDIIAGTRASSPMKNKHMVGEK